MTRNRKFAFQLAAAIVLCGACALLFMPPAGAQTPGASSTPPQKIVKGRFEVLHMMYLAIQVRSVDNRAEIHTLTYGPEIRDQMQKIFDAGGYQYGDTVVVWYDPGANVAVKIKGRPSKPK